MVARIVSGKNIRGILSYNENKVAEKSAELLAAPGFILEPSQLSFKNKLVRFGKLTALNERTKTNALHISLNFSVRDKLSNELLCRIADEYMEAIGFGSQPYLVYRHYDAGHPHIHIATVNIDAGGNRIETHNIGRNQSEKARKEIEEYYGLIKAEDQKNDKHYMLRPVPLEEVTYGKRETKAAISAVVREVVDSYKFTSLTELNAVLRQFNILAWPGAEGTVMREKGGLIYSILDKDGDPVGIPIKASSIYSTPTLKNLEKKFVQYKEERKPYLQRLRHLIDKALAGSPDQETLTAKLRENGIRVLLRQNDQGQVYGVTFIDNATRIVANGSSLGKEYSAAAFLKKMSWHQESGATGLPAGTATTSNAKSPTQQSSSKITASKGSREKVEPVNYPAATLPAIQRIISIAFSDEHEYESYDPYRKKKKRKGQQQD